MPLHTDYRPQDFDQIVGNKYILESLKSIFEREDDFPHAFLFHGASGCGKTTIARIISAKLGVDKPNEINSADMTGVDFARKIIKQARFKKIGGGNRVYLLDEVHMTSAQFQDALLKLLEDPPAHAYFILCTTDPLKLKETLRNRCHSYAVRKLKSKEIKGLLQGVLSSEEVELETAIIDEIIANADGCPREALKSLDEVIDIPEAERENVIKTIKGEDHTIKELCQALLEKKSWVKVSKLIGSLDTSNHEKIRRAVIGWMGKVVSGGKINEQAELVYTCFEKPFFSNGAPGLVFACYQCLT
jgi:DNA polymerase III gamma/tau subunit